MNGSEQRELPFDAAESETLSMRGNSMRENRETPATPSAKWPGPVGEDRSVEARHVRCWGVERIHSTDEAGEQRRGQAAEPVEGRGPAKGTRRSPTRSGHNAGYDVSWYWPQCVPAHKRTKGCRWAAHRHHPRWEPYEVVPQVRVCAGGGPKGPSLPRQPFIEKTGEKGCRGRDRPCGRPPAQIRT